MFGGTNPGLIFEEKAEVVLRTAIWRLPGEVRHLLGRPEVLLGAPVAIEAPPHAERLLMHDDRHLVDLAVATDATHPAPDVDGMVEVDVIRGLVDPHPGYGIATRPTGPDGGELCCPP